MDWSSDHRTDCLVKIGQVGSVVLRKEGTIVSGEGLPVSNYVLFGILIILGIYLLIPEEKLK